MSVHKLTRGRRVRYSVRWREGRRQRSRSFDRRADAEAFDAEMRRRSQLGAFAPAEPSKEPLRDWLRTWWQRDGVRWEPSTRSRRASVIDLWIVPYLGDVRLRDLGSARVRDWRAQIVERGCPPTQANHALSIVSAALGAAARDGLAAVQPGAADRQAAGLGAPAEGARADGGRAHPRQRAGAPRRRPGRAALLRRAAARGGARADLGLGRSGAGDRPGLHRGARQADQDPRPAQRRGDRAPRRGPRAAAARRRRNRRTSSSPGPAADCSTCATGAGASGTRPARRPACVPSPTTVATPTPRCSSTRAARSPSSPPRWATHRRPRPCATTATCSTSRAWERAPRWSTRSGPRGASSANMGVRKLFARTPMGSATSSPPPTPNWPFSRTFPGMGATGLEPVTPSLSSWCSGARDRAGHAVLGGARPAPPPSPPPSGRVGVREAVELGVPEQVRVPGRGEGRARVPELRRHHREGHPSESAMLPAECRSPCAWATWRPLASTSPARLPDLRHQVRHRRRAHRAAVPARPDPAGGVGAALDD